MALTKVRGKAIDGGTISTETAGTNNLGGGGGGGSTPDVNPSRAANGGTGVVFLKMATANYTGTTTGSPTVTTSGSDTIVKFTGTGTYTA